MSWNPFSKQDKLENTGERKASFWGKAPKALAMIGSSEIVEHVAQQGFFADYNIELENRDYSTVDELIGGLKKNSNAKYILLSDSALEGYGVDNAIKDIREQFPNLIIAVFFNDSEYSERFVNWAYGHKVYHLYYSDDGSFNFEIIAKELSEANILIAPDRTPPAEEESKVIAELEKKMEKSEADASEQIKNKDNEIDRLKAELAQAELKEDTIDNQREVFQLKNSLDNVIDEKTGLEEALNKMRESHAKEMRVLEEQMEAREQAHRQEIEERAKIEEALLRQNEEIRAAINAKKEVTHIKAHGTGTMTIGVFAISRGAGATYTAIALAEALGQKGYSAVIVPMDLKEDVACVELQYSHACPTGMGNNKDMLLAVMNQQWDFIVEDFGRVFPLDVKGRIESGDVSQERENITELKRCNLKIAVGFSEPWHIDKFRYFVETSVLDEQSTIYALTGISSIKGIEKLNLHVCERDEGLILQVLQFFNLERELAKKTKEVSRTNKKGRFFGL